MDSEPNAFSSSEYRKYLCTILSLESIMIGNGGDWHD